MAETVSPYPNMGSGWSGSETSRERQEREDRTGVTAEAQNRALELLGYYGEQGMTVAEFENASGYGHGRASSALSHLQRAGIVTRLTEKRQRCQVYVLPEHVGDRGEAPYLPNRSARPAQRPPSAYTADEVLAAFREARGFTPSDVVLSRIVDVLRCLKPDGAQ